MVACALTSETCAGDGQACAERRQVDGRSEWKADGDERLRAQAHTYEPCVIMSVVLAALGRSSGAAAAAEGSARASRERSCRAGGGVTAQRGARVRVSLLHLWPACVLLRWFPCCAALRLWMSVGAGSGGSGGGGGGGGGGRRQKQRSRSPWIRCSMHRPRWRVPPPRQVLLPQLLSAEVVARRGGEAKKRSEESN